MSESKTASTKQDEGVVKTETKSTGAVDTALVSLDCAKDMRLPRDGPIFTMTEDLKLTVTLDEHRDRMRTPRTFPIQAMWALGEDFYMGVSCNQVIVRDSVTNKVLLNYNCNAGDSPYEHYTCNRDVDRFLGVAGDFVFYMTFPRKEFAYKEYAWGLASWTRILPRKQFAVSDASDVINPAHGWHGCDGRFKLPGIVTMNCDSSFVKRFVCIRARDDVA